MIKEAVAKLLPREDKFYRLMGGLADEARLCAIHLDTFVKSGDKNLRTTELTAINESRIRSKKLSSDITRELCSTFITPYDREDIQDFSHSLYKIIKTIKKIGDRLDMHGLVNGKSARFARQTGLIVQEAEAMQDMVHELTKGHHNDRIVAKVNVLHDLENEGDMVLNELLADLFRDETDIKQLILLKDLYDMLEKVIDRYRNAGAVALQIVLKHS
ncbi:MAG: DUF47 family protein [Alphaproteobacteria bacterium PRO2]|nr:DUF47 family protein [Alphaproteobacteria bacterium PRO2]